MSSEYKKDITAVSKRTEKGTAFLEPGDQSIVVRSASFSYTVKKIEKLASGLHLVTNSIPVTESVRERMRDASLRILSNFLMIDSGTNELVIRHITAIENSIIELIMLLNIAHTAEYISFMNKDVLIREYTQLLEFIREHRGTLTAEDTAISDEFFKFVDEGKIVVKCYTYPEYEKIYTELFSKIREDGEVKRLVIDSFNCFFSSVSHPESLIISTEVNIRRMINQAFSMIRDKGLTTILILEMQQDYRYGFYYNIPYLVDGIINLDFLELGMIERRIFIPKMRNKIIK